MKKLTGTCPIAYTFDKAHKGAPYMVGGLWMNHGELLEVETKALLGYEPKKDANGKYTDCSDLPELNANMKSDSATIKSVIPCDCLNDSIITYIQTDFSSNYIYTAEYKNELSVYFMTANEFLELVQNFGTWETNRKAIRLRETSSMRKWLNERI